MNKTEESIEETAIMTKAIIDTEEKLNLPLGILTKEIDGSTIRFLMKETIKQTRLAERNKIIDKELLEKLAELEHNQWCHWTKYFLSMRTKENENHWREQMRIPYSELSEEEKNSDRSWARKVLEVIKQNKPTKKKLLDKQQNKQKLES